MAKSFRARIPKSNLFLVSNKVGKNRWRMSFRKVGTKQEAVAFNRISSKGNVAFAFFTFDLARKYGLYA